MKNFASKVKRRLKRIRSSIVHRLTQKNVYASVYSEIIANPCVKIVVETKDFFQKEIGGDGDFNRYDTIVRYLAVENYYGKNDFGFELYRRMQKSRNPKTYESKNYQETFERLIRSFEKFGFDDRYPLEVSNELRLLDGSHRFALILYHGTPSFSVSPVNSPRNTQVDFKIGWFEQNGFTTEEIAILKDTYCQLKSNYVSTFAGVLWSPAFPFKDEILADIEAEFGSVESDEIEFDNRANYEKFVSGIYHIDDIETWKVRKKLEYMKNDPTKVCTFSFETPNPRFRKKTRNDQAISIVVELIKKKLRGKYAERLENYFYDILLHIGDNEQHTKYMKKLYRPSLDICRFAENIKDLDYVFIKTDTPYTPDEFPKQFPLGKDLDIICTDASYPAVHQEAMKLAEKSNQDFEVRTISNDFGTKVRFELEGFLIYQIDLRSQSHDLDTDAIISRREPFKNYFVPTLADEVIIRCKEYLADNSKQHHLAFVNSKMDQLDDYTRQTAGEILGRQET